MDNNTFWVLYGTGHERFPYRLRVIKNKEILLDLMAQDRWPGTKGNIFCMQSDGRMEEGQEEIERVPIINFSAYGKRISLTLDRANRKRCSFLFLTKKYKNKEGEYEQIFWQTQQGLSSRKSKYKLAYSRGTGITVFVDSAERYAWKFPGTETVKEKLPIGDYAIKDDYGYLAVVERKTFSNLMGEFGNLKKFHQHLLELDSCKNSALLVEASYLDFLDKNKIRPYTGSFGAKAIAEIQALHPALPLVFCGSRKAAIAWTFHYFQTIAAKAKDLPEGVVKDSSVKYGAVNKAVYNEDEARRTVLKDMPDKFTTRLFRENLPQLRAVEARRLLEKMKNEGILSVEKNGRDLVWKKLCTD